MVVYICKRLDTENEEQLYILKCKVQAPSVLAGGLTTPIPGPSEHTAAELQALQKFKDEKAEGLPHLIAWKRTVQDETEGWPMPGGYAVYVVMTLMPGLHLMDLGFWSIDESEREAIRDAFKLVIHSVWRMGFEPYDCALRNILWNRPTKTLYVLVWSWERGDRC